jgi:hypothetical protein
MLIRACPESFVEIQVCLAAKHPPGSSGFICSPAEQEAEHLWFMNPGKPWICSTLAPMVLDCLDVYTHIMYIYYIL